MIGLALIEILKSNTAAQSLLGDATRFRFFLEIIPQKQSLVDQLPCAVYSVSSGRFSKTYCGTIPLTMVTVTIDNYGLKPEDAVAVQSVIRAALLDFKGDAGGFAISDVSLQNTYSASDMEPGLFRLVDEFIIWYS